MQDLDLFNISCEQILAGRYILIDSVLSSLLKVIDENEKLKIIVSKALSQHNFSDFFNNEISSDVSLPADNMQIIAFVYTFIFKYKNNEISFTENDSSIVTKFISKFIPSFQTAINDVFAKNHKQIEADEYQNNIFNSIKATINLILENLDKYKFNTTNKEEFLMLINSLYIACEKNDQKLVYSLMIGLDYFTLSNKKLRNIYLTLEECFES